MVVELDDKVKGVILFGVNTLSSMLKGLTGAPVHEV